METMKIAIDTEYIPANNLLKYAGVVDTGGQAAQLIEEGLVYLDGNRISEKRKKVYPGSHLQVRGQWDIEVTAEDAD